MNAVGNGQRPPPRPQLKAPRHVCQCRAEPRQRRLCKQRRHNCGVQLCCRGYTCSLQLDGVPAAPSCQERLRSHSCSESSQLTLTGEGTALHSLMHPSPPVWAHNQRECARRAELVSGSPDMPMQTAASAEKKSKKECVLSERLALRTLRAPRNGGHGHPGRHRGACNPMRYSRIFQVVSQF